MNAQINHFMYVSDSKSCSNLTQNYENKLDKLEEINTPLTFFESCMQTVKGCNHQNRTASKWRVQPPKTQQPCDVRMKPMSARHQLAD